LFADFFQHSIPELAQKKNCAAYSISQSNCLYSLVSVTLVTEVCDVAHTNAVSEAAIASFLTSKDCTFNANISAQQ
jgi:hypothetical protein